MEDGILKKDLLSLKEIHLDSEVIPHFRDAIIYKHYIFCLRREEEVGDCAIIDTHKGTVTNTSTGLNLGARSGCSISHWKDNIFVICGGFARTGSQQNGVPPVMIEFLYVIEEDARITFEAVANGSNMRRYGDQSHLAHIYKDKMYILGILGDPNSFDVWRIDLSSQGRWANLQKCEIKNVDGAPKPRYDPVSALFNDKIYVFGGYKMTNYDIKNFNDLFALDLESMQWVKIQEKDFLPFLPNSAEASWATAEVVGKKIYIKENPWSEFYIYDPVKNTLLQSEVSLQGFMLKSHQYHSILFSINPEKGIEFHDFSFEEPVQESQISLLPQPKKHILSQLLHMNLLWRDKPFSDVTFVVESEEIQAHRIILLKCHHFQNMFNSGMMEASSNQINIPDISPTNFKAILEYIYFGKISLTEQLALDLIILADMYCMAELKADCENYLSINIKIANLLKIIKTVEIADSQRLEARIMSFLIENIEKLQQEVDIREIPHELLVKSIIKMKQKTSLSNPTSSFLGK